MYNLDFFFYAVVDSLPTSGHSSCLGPFSLDLVPRTVGSDPVTKDLGWTSVRSQRSVVHILHWTKSVIYIQQVLDIQTQNLCKSIYKYVSSCLCSNCLWMSSLSSHEVIERLQIPTARILFCSSQQQAAVRSAINDGHGELSKATNDSSGSYRMIMGGWTHTDGINVLLRHRKKMGREPVARVSRISSRELSNVSDHVAASSTLGRRINQMLIVV